MAVDDTSLYVTTSERSDDALRGLGALLALPQRAEAVAKNLTARARDLTIKEQRAIACCTVIIKSWRHLVMCICREGG